MRLARPLLAFLATTWILLLATAPTAALGVPVSGLVYAFGSLICHQRPDRSFHLAAVQLPVCARCFGLYVGAATGAVVALAFAGLRGRAASPDMWGSASALRLAIALAAVPTAVTWTSEIAGVWSSSNLVRFVAALPLGAAVALAAAVSVSGRERRSLR